MLREFLAWRSDESAEEQLAQLESSLELAGLKPAEALPLIAPLLNLPLPAKYPPSSLSPEQQRRRLLATLVEWVLGAARAQPMVIAIEDLHWADPSTLELLQLLVEQGATARLLLLYTARPEFHAQWPLRAHHTQITLNRLSSRNVRTMVEEVAAQKALSEETIATVVERTGGVPLFVEELTRAVLEGGDAKLTGREIPVTLHDSLMARLDRLGPAKEVAQVGAVIGSEFSYELLHAVHPIAEEDLQRALRMLADAELLYVRGIAPDATYQFKHALIRDAAYEALLKSRRRDLHRLVARTIDEKFPVLKEVNPEVLARHWTEAGETQPAIVEWTRAGTVAEARHAFSEALANYQQSVRLLKLLPESSERDHRELELRQSAAQMLYLRAEGYAAPKTGHAIEQATALAEKTGNLTQLVAWTLRKWLAPFNSGDLPFAAALRRPDARACGSRRQPSKCRDGTCHSNLDPPQSWRPPRSRPASPTAGLKFFDDSAFRQVPGAASWTFGLASYNASLLGRPDVARERMVSIVSAVSENKPHDQAISDICAAQLRHYLKEYEQAEVFATKALERSEKHQFLHEIAHFRWRPRPARAQARPRERGYHADSSGDGSLCSKAGLRLTIPTYFGTQLSRSSEQVLSPTHSKPLSRLSTPILTRSRAGLKLSDCAANCDSISDRKNRPESDFREAIMPVAQKMSAKAWELRATMSLARLLRKTGPSR